MKDAVQDTLLIATVTGGTFAVISLANLQAALSCLLLTISIAFTAWKWYHALKKKK